jgi:hypothetical protein
VVPREIAVVRAKIDAWRKRKKGGEAMPPELWAAAVSLARGKHTIYEVSRWLKVDYGALKRRVAEEEDADVPRLGSGAATADRDCGELAEREDTHGALDDEADALRFIELRGESLFGPSSEYERVVELVGADGTRMTIRQPVGVELDVVGLVASFWRRGS